MAFKPGESGNPGGRPKEAPEVKALAREHGPEAITKLASWMRSDDPRASVAAAQALLDRGFGKPAQSVGQDPDLGPIQVTWAAPATQQLLTDEH